LTSNLIPNVNSNVTLGAASRSPWVGASTAHYENFPVGSVLLPANIRPAVAALYQFARYADDVADEGNAASADRLLELARLRDALTPGSTITHAIVAPLLPVIEQFSLDRALLFDLLSAFEQDVQVNRYADRAQLLDYCQRSANPVGRLMLQLSGCLDATSGQLSDRICSALQLINFAQDVAIDWRKDRLYLPLDELALAQLAPADIAAACAQRCANPSLRSLIAQQANHAQLLLDEGRPLFARVPWRLALELRAIVAAASRVLQLLADYDFDPIARRPVLRKRDALAVVLGMFR
jgi:squalene synthase HpnC